MTAMSMIQALNSALEQKLADDPNVLTFGEDVGYFGGVFGVTKGLQEKFGSERVFDAPINESAIVALAMGMATNGMRPVAEIQFADYIFPAFDQIVNETAKFRYRSGDLFNVGGLTIRTPYGGGISGGLYHSQSPEAYFTHTPGLKVVVPRNPYQAKGLLLAAIRDPDPVLFLEPKRLYRAAVGEVPDEDYQLPIGEAEVIKEGTDITLVGWGAQMEVISKAAELAEEQGISCEVIDLRSLLPLDLEAIVASVQKTGRCVVVHEAPRTSGYGGELAAQIMEECFWQLEAPVERVTGWDTPYPHTLEWEYFPSQERVMEAIARTMENN